MAGLPLSQRNSPGVGRVLRATSRLAGRKAGENRWVRAIWAGASATLQSFTRVGKLLFLQITGVFFVFFGFAGGYAALREYHKWSTGHAGPGKFVLAAGFAVLFAWFGLSSFWRAGTRG